MNLDLHFGLRQETLAVSAGSWGMSAEPSRGSPLWWRQVHTGLIAYLEIPLLGHLCVAARQPGWLQSALDLSWRCVNFLPQVSHGAGGRARVTSLRGGSPRWCLQSQTGAGSYLLMPLAGHLCVEASQS